MQYLEKQEAGGKLDLAIFGSRLLSDGNSVLCQLILRNSARFSVMSASIFKCCVLNWPNPFSNACLFFPEKILSSVWRVLRENPRVF